MRKPTKNSSTNPMSPGAENSPSNPMSAASGMNRPRMEDCTQAGDEMSNPSSAGKASMVSKLNKMSDTAEGMNYRGPLSIASQKRMPTATGGMDSPKRYGGPPQGPSGTDTDAPTTRRCATMENHRRLLAEVPGYAASRARVENEVMQLVRSYRMGTAAQRAGVATIQVVVHVVYNTAAQNVSDAQIQSQIDVLNRDFRKLNPDVASVPAVWQPLVADCNLEFQLAQVTRTQTTRTSFGGDDSVKSAATGGADPIDPSRYLNIWVCRLSGSLLGYAQFPGGLPQTDGVVITYTGFGTIGTATAPFHLGRTGTHEIGHYFDLFHIWGDDEDGCTGSDQVDDTPNQGGANLGMPVFPKISCGNGPNGDMFVNYMDYTDDAGMVMFTNGQLARMEACLAGPRSSLIAASTRSKTAGQIVSWAPGRLDAFVLGTNMGLFHKWYDGGWGPSLTDYEAMGGICTSQPEVVSWAPGRLDVFLTGTDRALYHKWFDGSWGPSLTDYEYMGGVCRSAPRAVSWGPGRLDVFVIGTDGALYHKWYDGGWGPSLTDWEYMGGNIIGTPKIVSWASGRLDIFVVGLDSALYHKWYDGGWGPSLTDWEYMGGAIHGDVEAVSWAPGRLDVFVLGTDQALYHKWYDGGWGPSLTDYEYMGGVCTSSPKVVSWGPGRLDVFVTGTDSALYHKWYDGGWGPSLTDFEGMGGVIQGEPKVVSWAPGRLDVFVTGTDSALYHKWFDGSWGPSLTDYEYMGGILIEAGRSATPATRKVEVAKAS